MNLNGPTGSLMNNIGANAKYPNPEVGMGATKFGWTDRTPFTIIEVKGKTIKVQEDIATRTDTNGMSECQSYTFSPDPHGTIYTVTLRSNGRWVLKGEPAKNGTTFGIGQRQKYHDYSF